MTRIKRDHGTHDKVSLTLWLPLTGPALMVDLLELGIHLPVVLHLLHHEHPGHVVKVDTQLLREEVLLRLDPDPVSVDPRDAAVPLLFVAFPHNFLKSGGTFISTFISKLR